MPDRTARSISPFLAAWLPVVLVAAGCDGAGPAGKDAGADNPGEVAELPADASPGTDVALDGDVVAPPFAWQPPFGELLPSGSVITPEAGGTVVTDDGRVEVSFPPGAVAVPTTVTLAPLDVPGPPDASDVGLGVTVDARDPDGAPVTRLAGHAYLYFHHDALAFVADRREDLVVHAHDAAVPEAGGWTPLPTVPSPQGGTALARTDHFSGFGLYAPALTGFLGCQPGAGCRTSINRTNPISSMGMDAAGNLYFMHPDGPWIYRRPAGGGPGDVETFFNAADAYGGTWLYANKVAVSDRTSDVFLLRHDQVFRVRPDTSWSLLYPPATEAGTKVHGFRYDPNDGTLWVQCRDGALADTLRQLNASSGEVLNTVEFNTARRVLGIPMAWTFDPGGRLFAMKDWSLFVLDDPIGDPTEPWKLVAEGFPGTRQSLAADAEGNVFVATGVDPCTDGATCTPSDQLAVVNGTPAFPNQRIAGLRNPYLVVVARGLLLVSSGDAITTLPLDRRNALDGHASGITSPSMGSLSGRGSFVKLNGTLASSAVHHAVWMDGIRLNLARILPGELRFTIPSYAHKWETAAGLLPDLGAAVRMTLPPGEVSMRAGPDSKSLGRIETPEPGHYKPVFYSQSRGSGTCLPAASGLQQPPLQVATGEWVYWPGAANQAWSVASRDGLFPTWDGAEDGPWMAYHFTRPGDYTFDWTQGDQVLECSIRVTPGGAPAYQTEFRVVPAVGGTFFSNGARIVIPPGALPGTAPYDVQVTTTEDPPPASDAPEPDDPPQRHRQFFHFSPDPGRLQGTVRFGLPIGGDDDHPVPAFFDNGLAAGVPEAYRQSMYVPIEHEVDSAAGYVNLLLTPGDYPGDRAEARSAPPRSPAVGAAAASVGEAVSWLGHRIKAGVNEVGGYLWWKVGMPNEKVEDEHFTIVYNTREGMTEAKALAAYAGLTAARSEFSSRGYAVPAWTIVTLDPGLSSEGSTSGLGRLTHWNMSLGGWQVDDDLRTAAAHELFHIIQYENMAADARALKFNWKWWMEGTAMWAEHELFPGSSAAGAWVAKGSDFIRYGLANYGSLTDAQAYATVALILHLEKEHEGAVLAILKALGTFTAPDEALRTLVGSVPVFLEEFALSYFGGVDEPYKSWDLSKAFLPPRVLAQPVTELVAQVVNGESAVAVKVATNPNATPPVTPPVSFDAASGSVIRVGNRQPLQTTFVLDRAGTKLGTIVGTATAEGLVMDKASKYTPANPLTVIHVLGEDLSAGFNPMLVLEVPTLNAVAPPSFHYASSVDLALTGGGFGPGELAGQVVLFYGDYVAQTWTPDRVVLSLPGSSLSPMDVSVQVKNRAGVTSNVRTVTVTGE